MSCKRFEPRTRSRQLSLLEAVMQPDLTGSSQDVVNKLNQWEQQGKLYDQAANTSLADDIRIAVVLKSVIPVLRAQLHLLLAQPSSATVDYPMVREFIVRFAAAGQEWTSTMPIMLGSSSSGGGGGPSPMDVGALGKQGKPSTSGVLMLEMDMQASLKSIMVAELWLQSVKKSVAENSDYIIQLVLKSVGLGKYLIRRLRIGRCRFVGSQRVPVVAVVRSTAAVGTSGRTSAVATTAGAAYGDLVDFW